MKQVYGIWFPENDTHFDENMIHPNGDYQRDTFQAAMGHVKEPKLFIDIGAHVGLWSRMAETAGFQEVHAFEPNPETFQCLKLNIKGNAANCGVAISDKELSIEKQAPNNTGAIRLIEGSGVHVINLNNRHFLDFPIEEYSSQTTLVKIDTEGMEADCVLGMDKIIYALRPVVCVEQRSNKDALDILQKMGMQIVKQVRQDYILTWKNQ